MRTSRTAKQLLAASIVAATFVFSWDPPAANVSTEYYVATGASLGTSFSSIGGMDLAISKPVQRLVGGDSLTVPRRHPPMRGEPRGRSGPMSN